MHGMICFCKYSDELKTSTYFGSSFFNGCAEQLFLLLKARRNENKIN